MAIDRDSFLRWCESKFDGQFLVSGEEIKINSIFTEDSGYHLWCNVKGGKHKREDGVYHCWKTGERGTLLGLVMKVESCSFQEAKEILSGNTSLSVLEQRLDEFFENKQEEIPKKIESNLKLPEDACLISELSPRYYRQAEDYILNRKLSIDRLYYCTGGDYYNRIIIPYYDRYGKLIYFNSRHIGKSKFRYMGPPKTCGVGKSDVLFARHWPESGSKIYLTEGEFDAMTLSVCGLYGFACGGKILSDKQLEMLKPYKVCLALDMDQKPVAAADPGLKGLMEMGEKLLTAFIPVTYVRPPKGFKDWNKMLIDLKNPAIIAEYINKCEKVFDPLTLEQLMCLV